MNKSTKEMPFKNLGTGKVSVEPYRSKEHFEREKDVIWRNSWLMAGRESDVAEENDYMVFELEVLSMSIVITRADDGKLRAFHNICRHRGHKLCDKVKGNSKLLVCPFHAWSYDMTGKLRGLRWEESFPEGVDRDTSGLSPVAVDTWGGFVFVNVNPEPKKALKEHLDVFSPVQEAYLRERDWHWFAGNVYMVNHNWKMGIEGSEAYHAEILHRETMGMPFPSDNVQNTVFDSTGVPYRETILMPEMPTPPDGVDMQQFMMEMMAATSSPSEMLAAKYSSLSGMQSGFSGEDTDAYAGAYNLENNPRWLFDGYCIFPNQFIIFHEYDFHVMSLWPIDVNTSLYHWDSYQLGEPKNFGELFGRLHKTIFSDVIAGEDIHAAESLQRSFDSGAIDSVYVGDGEVIVRALQKAASEGI